MARLPPLLEGGMSLYSARPRVRLRFSLLPALALLVFLSLLVLPRDSRPQLRQWSPPRDAGAVPSNDDVIPNYVHFVYVLPKPESNFSFQFSHFLSIYAAWHYWKPDAIFLHTNAAADSDAVTRARSGLVGKWNRLIFTLFDLRINTVPLPVKAGNGKDLENMEHKSDFVRVKAVHDFGGIYIDWDVHPLRDIAPLRLSGFKAVAGRQLYGQLNSGTFLSARGGKLISLWMERMHQVYDGRWTTHSNEAMTDIGQRLIREPWEMLILDREAFAPGSWEERDNEMLFSAHNETKSNLDGLVQSDRLPVYEEGFADRWEHPERFEQWERDWSATYLLHAFSPVRFNRTVPGFENISPRYVLERQSNFARAVYPVAKEMYDRGLISIDDSHLGTE
ncbi:hypothetical protein VTK26DRAFT_6412 [Humicola hyalothermophila]